MLKRDGGICLWQSGCVFDIFKTLVKFLAYTQTVTLLDRVILCTLEYDS